MINNGNNWNSGCISTFPPHWVPTSTDDISLAIVSHYWDAETGDNDCFVGKGHTNQVSEMAVNEAEELVSCSMDDTLRFTSLKTKEYR